MLHLLAELERDEALTKGYLLLFWIALAGLIGMLTIVGLLLIRRATRRRLEALERDMAERRQAGSAGRVDAWSAGADRYVDRDKLPDDLPYDTEPDAADDPNATNPAAEDEEEDEDQELEDYTEDPPPGSWNQPNPEEESDPFGLFEDKPFREADDEEEDPADSDPDWDEETDQEDGEDEEEGEDRR